MFGGPRIVDTEECEAREVVRIEFEDGRSASIWERFLLPAPSMFTFYNKWDPGMISLWAGQGASLAQAGSAEAMVRCWWAEARAAVEEAAARTGRAD